jgi:predicted metalloprotease with PDZ domain
VTTPPRRSPPSLRTVLTVALIALATLASCGDRRRDREPGPVVHRPDPVTPRSDGPAIEYTVRFPAPHTHYLEVEAVYPAAGEQLELMMAVWTPGSYLVREFSRNVEGLSAATLGGEPLAVDKTRKNRWRVATGGADRVAVRYRVYARELSVRTSFVSAEHAILNGAPTFVTADGLLDRPHDVRLEPAAGWARVVTALPPHPDGGEHRYLAADFDMLVDSPILLGDPAIREFVVEGVPHVIADLPADPRWDPDRAARDLEALTAEQIRFWRIIPYDRYWFLNVVLGGRGGLEHLRSTLMIIDPWAMKQRTSYLSWLGLVSHELFHVWNVKRLRPVALGPFDYENEVYTRSLWVAEGITSYYDDLLLHRAGLMDQDEYLEALSRNIESVQDRPGRAVQSLADSSFDAWIEYYRPDENSGNTTISYYTKGAAVSWLLDTAIREATSGRRSLDDVLRLGYQRHAGEAGFTPEQFRALVAEVAGRPMDDFFARYVDGTDELDYQPALDYYGLRFAGPSAVDLNDEPAGYLGARLSGAVVTEVRRDTPAFAAGLNVGDELIALDDWRVPAGELDSRLERYRPGDEVSVLVARHGTLRRLPVTLGEAPNMDWTLAPVPAPTRTQQAHLRAWLSPSRRW